MVPSGRRPPPPPPQSPTSPLQKASQDPSPPPLPRRHPKDEPDVKTDDEYEQPVQAKDYEPMTAPNPVNTTPQSKKGFAPPKPNIISNLEMALKKRQAESNRSENSPKSWNPFQIEQKPPTNNKSPFSTNKNTDKERKISDPKQPHSHLTLPDKPRRLTEGDAAAHSMPTQDDVYEEPQGPPQGPPPRVPTINPRHQPSHDESTDESWDEDWEDGGQDSKKEDDGEVYEIPDGAEEDYVPVDDGKPPPLPKDRPALPTPPVTNNKKELPPATPLKPLIAQFLKSVPQKDQNKKTPPVNKPAPPVIKPAPPVNKPAPPEKPTKKPDGPQLPPRVQEKRNSRSDDSSAGSTSSGSVSMHQETAQTNGTQDLRSQTKIQEPIDPAPCDEIYDDAASEYLGTYDWFHPKVDRKEAERRIIQLRENGSFLVRESGSGKDGGTHPYTLVVLYNSKPYNLQLRERSDKRFAIGKHKPDEVSFNTVPELITHHKSNNIKLEEGTVMLKNTPPKR